MESRAKKYEEKTLKYGPMMRELKQRYIGYRVEQYNVPREVGEEATRPLERVQKSVISNTLNIVRTFKINT